MYQFKRDFERAPSDHLRSPVLLLQNQLKTSDDGYANEIVIADQGLFFINFEQRKNCVIFRLSLQHDVFNS